MFLTVATCDPEPAAYHLSFNAVSEHEIANMLSILVTALACAALVASQYAYPTCTTTLTHTGSQCCPAVPTATSTTYTDCNGCALTSETVPLQCFAPCSTTATSGVSTITKCRPSPTPSMQTDIRGSSSSALSQVSCTSTITEFRNPCGACFSTSTW